jgi:hypothetical protein
MSYPSLHLKPEHPEQWQGETSHPPFLPPSLYCLSLTHTQTQTHSSTHTHTHTHTHTVSARLSLILLLLLPATNNNTIIVSSRDTTTPSRPPAVSPLFCPARKHLVRLLPAILAAASLTVVLGGRLCSLLADASSTALLALASLAVVLADA